MFTEFSVPTHSCGIVPDNGSADQNMSAINEKFNKLVLKVITNNFSIFEMRKSFR